MYCSKCGKENSNESCYCSYCGNELKPKVQQENNKEKNEQGKVIIHSYEGFYLANPKVKVYENDKLITTLSKASTFEYSINKSTTLTFKCGIRKTTVTLNPNTFTDIKLSFDNFSGELQAICNEQKFNEQNNNIEQLENQNIVNSTNDTIKVKSKKNNIVIAVILSIIIVIFVGDYLHTQVVNGKTISTKDIKYIVSTFNSRVISVESEYKSSEDGNGRTIGTFTYKSYPYNKQGMTLTNQTYTSTITVMFMKKNGIVEYVICPSDWLIQTTYKNYEDFKTQNHWGEPESKGLGSKSKSFTSE